MLIFDACGIKNWSGPGYRCPLKKNTSESAGSSYDIMVRHPEVQNINFFILIWVLVDLFSSYFNLSSISSIRGTIVWHVFKNQSFDSSVSFLVLELETGLSAVNVIAAYKLFLNVVNSWLWFTFLLPFTLDSVTVMVHQFRSIHRETVFYWNFKMHLCASSFHTSLTVSIISIGVCESRKYIYL